MAERTGASAAIHRRLFLGGLLGAACSGRDPIRLRGAGATMPSRQYRSWFAAYTAAVPRVSVDYAAVGSGAGVRQLRSGAIDFGASDVGVPLDERAGFPGEILVVPVAMSALSVAYNLRGVGPALRLRRETIARIYLGEIRSWDDREIAADNPGAGLPHAPITPIGRADGGGSTAIFTRALAARSAVWRDRVGAGLAVTHPHSVNARGTDGIADLLLRIPGSIGYVEVARASHASLPVASLDDAQGRFLLPTAEAVGAAADDLAAGDDWSASPSAGYPLASATFLIVPESIEDVAKGSAMARMLHWVLTQGQLSLANVPADGAALVGTLAPLPPSALARARALVRRLHSGSVALLSID
jgi:phosphate transport system substrate-binding protein